MSSDSTKPIDTDVVNYVWNNTEWDYIPDPILLKILAQLPVRDILNASECCRRWNDITKDDYLWKKVFQRDFKVDKTIALKPGKDNFHHFESSKLFDSFKRNHLSIFSSAAKSKEQKKNIDNESLISFLYVWCIS